MNQDFRAKVAAAKAHIEKIRHGYGIQTAELEPQQSLCTQALEKSLTIISQNLYSSGTRLLCELVQNADDTKYDRIETAELDIRIFDTTIEIRTNETGFDDSDVDALCGIANSTKRGNSNTIGEKGIGFKSVFKICHTAVVQSGPYSFKFDANPPLKELGTIVPTWVERNLSELEKSKGTLLTLAVRKHLTGADCVRPEDIDPNLILFLRQVKRIKAEWFPCDKFPKPPKTICKEVKVVPKNCDDGIFDLLVTSTSLPAELRTNFVTSSHEINYTPRKEGRLKRQRAIVLAFPSCNGLPLVQDQQIYAFLPIKSIGFKFHIHADFALTASREDIDSDSLWNKKILSELPKAFQKAVSRICRSEDDRLKYRWPQYLDGLSSLPKSFLRSAGPKMIEAAKVEKCLISEDGTIREPSELMIVGPFYKQKNGAPLISHGNLRNKLLSTKYPAQSSEGLKTLGVKEMTFNDFLEHFKHFIAFEKGLQFRTMETTWHSQVAGLLSEHMLRRNLRSTSLDLHRYPICPLEDGSWVSADMQNLFLPCEDEISAQFFQSLSGITVNIIDQEAAEDPQRRGLFRSIGILPCQQSSICNIILRAHAQNSPSAFSVDDLVSHAVYLFKAGHTPSASAKFFFANNKGEQSDRKTYLTFGSTGNIVRCLFQPDRGVFSQLHTNYEVAVSYSEQDEWFDWLSTWPNIETQLHLHAKGKLSPELRYIHEHDGSRVFLATLRDISDHIGTHLVYPPSSASEISSIKQEIQALEVKTHDGVFPLGETALPIFETGNDSFMHLIELENPRSRSWLFLKEFGVLTDVDLSFYMRQLMGMKENLSKKPTEKGLMVIYQMIGKQVGRGQFTDDAINSDGNAQLSKFESQHLIYTDVFQWRAPSECLWNATFPCTCYPVLSNIYGKCKYLFQEVLGIRNAGLEEIIEEIRKASSGRGVEASRIPDLLFALNDLLALGEWRPDEIIQLMDLQIIPVTRTAPNTNLPELALVSPSDSFWIADRSSLSKAFSGLAPLTRFPISHICQGKLDHIIKALGLEERRLSRAVEESIHLGEAVRDPAYTVRLSAMAPYIVGIIEKYASSMNVEYLENQLHNLQVFRVESINLHRSLLDVNTIVNGEPVDGRVLVQHAPDGLEIYMQTSEIKSFGFSPTLVDRLGEILDLSEEGQNILQRIMVRDKPEEILDILEKHHIGVAKDEIRAKPIRRINSSQFGGSDGGESDLEVFQPRKLSWDTLNDAMDQSEQITSPDVTLGTSLERPQPDSSSTSPTAVVAPTLNTKCLSSGSKSPTDLPNGDLNAQTNSTYRFEDSYSSVGMNARPSAPLRRPLKAVERLSQVMDNLSQAVETLSFSTNGLEEEISEHEGETDACTTMIETNLEFCAAPSDDTSPEPQNRLGGRSSNDPPATSASRTMLSASWNETHWHRSSHSRRRSSIGHSSCLSWQVGGEDQHVIGYHGEKLVFDFLCKLLGESFSNEKWTSKNRNKAFPDPRHKFDSPEGQFADFTFQDNNGTFTEYLLNENMVPPMLQSLIVGTESAPKSPTYHLEVKSTIETLETAFFMSNNQMNMARSKKLDYKSSDLALPAVYVLVRVYDLKCVELPTGKFRMYVDPWRLIFGGQMLMKSCCDKFNINVNGI